MKQLKLAVIALFTLVAVGNVNAQDENNGMGVPTAQADPTRTITSAALPIIYNYPTDTSFYDALAVTATFHGDLA